MSTQSSKQNSITESSLESIIAKQSSKQSSKESSPKTETTVMFTIENEDLSKLWHLLSYRKAVRESYMDPKEGQSKLDGLTLGIGSHCPISSRKNQDLRTLHGFLIVRKHDRDKVFGSSLPSAVQYIRGIDILVREEYKSNLKVANKQNKPSQTQITEYSPVRKIYSTQDTIEKYQPLLDSDSDFQDFEGWNPKSKSIELAKEHASSIDKAQDYIWAISTFPCRFLTESDENKILKAIESVIHGDQKWLHIELTLIPENVKYNREFILPKCKESFSSTGVKDEWSLKVYSPRGIKYRNAK